MGGVQTQILTPPPLPPTHPPTPWEVQSVEEVWTTFFPKIWRQKSLFGTWWWVKIDFTLCVYAQNSQNFMGNSHMHAKRGNFFHP